MNDASIYVFEKDRKRYAILRKLYEITGDDTSLGLGIESFKLEQGESFADEYEFINIVRYLTNEGLAREVDLEYVFITHKGIKEVEQSIKRPEESTEHFMPIVIQNFNGPVGAVQTGNDNITHVTQNNGLALAEARNFIEVVRQSTVSLLPEQQEEAIEYIDDFEAEIISTNPKLSRLKAPVQALLGLVGRVGTAVGFIDAVHSLSEWLSSYLKQIG
jgi:hypothetical protein